MRHGEIEADKSHGFRSGDGVAQLIRQDIEREVAPVQSEGLDAGILHRGGRGVINRMAKNGAVARRGADRCGKRLGHGAVIGYLEAKSHKAMPGGRCGREPICDLRFAICEGTNLSVPAAPTIDCHASEP